jgi:uncharacterized protein
MGMHDAKVIWSKLVERKDQPSCTDQCNCACPDRSLSLAIAPGEPGRPLRQAQLHIQPLPASHTLLFNPKRDAGVAVVNDAGLEVWNRFRQPARPADIATTAKLAHAVEKLVLAGLLEPVGSDVIPRPAAPRALSAWLHMTNACNLRCDYCYIRKSPEEMPGDVGRAAVDAVMRSAARNGFRQVRIKFAGGEATLHMRRVLELDAYARAQAQLGGLEFESVVLSNGVAIGDHAIAEMQRRGMRMMISLDGVGAAHDAHRRFANQAGSFAWVDRTIGRLLECGIRPFISITLSSRNAWGLPDVAQYVLERDLPFNLNFFRDNDCAAAFGDLPLQDDIVIDALRRTFSVIERSLPERSLMGMLIDRAQFDQPHPKTCGVGDSYLVIDQRGRVAKCHMEIERPVGDVTADDPLSLARADRTGVQNIAADEKAGCRECMWKHWCAGGCPALTYRATGRYDVKSPYCRIYLSAYPALLRLEGLRLMKLISCDL